MEQTNHRPRIVMFAMNDLLNDPRVQREARLAVRAGFRVTVVATQSVRCRVPRETVDGYDIVRVRVPRFRIIWFARKLGVIWQEGMKRALGLPPGPEGPSREVGAASVFRSAEWALMRGIGILLRPLRLFRRRLGWPTRALHARDQPHDSSGGYWYRLYRYVDEFAFLRDTAWITLAMLWAARSVRAGVFHGNDLPTLPVTSWAARRVGGKALYDSHELWVEMSPDWTSLLNAVAGWVERRYIRQMDAVVTVNDLIADELRRRYQIPQPTVVMNCPEPAVPRAADPVHSIRARLVLSPETPIILYQGRYEPGRGLEQLIESGRYLSQGVIVLRGYGSKENDLRDRVARLGVTGRVFMVDPVPMAELVTAAAEADVGVVPYTAYSPGYYYTSPNKLFEYMMAGLAIAVSNLPVLEKLVRDHDLGVVFDPSDPRHIAEQLNALVGNPERLRACRTNSIRTARERYNWDHEGGKLIELYRTLAVANTRRGSG